MSCPGYNHVSIAPFFLYLFSPFRLLTFPPFFLFFLIFPVIPSGKRREELSWTQLGRNDERRGKLKKGKKKKKRCQKQDRELHYGQSRIGQASKQDNSRQRDPELEVQSKRAERKKKQKKKKSSPNKAFFRQLVSPFPTRKLLCRPCLLKSVCSTVLWQEKKTYFSKPAFKTRALSRLFLLRLIPQDLYID